MEHLHSLTLDYAASTADTMEVRTTVWCQAILLASWGLIQYKDVLPV